MALLISARINDFHAKSVFVIRSYVITRETIWLAMLNLLIRCISPSHIIINVVNSNDRLTKLWQLLLLRIQYCWRHLKLIFLLSELIRAITQMAAFCISRIHYPLPLPYVGKPDPVQLQETIRKLREENQHLKEQVKLWLCTSLQTILLVTVTAVSQGFQVARCIQLVQCRQGIEQTVSSFGSVSLLCQWK